jgi:hypothetical protein
LDTFRIASVAGRFEPDVENRFLHPALLGRLEGPATNAGIEATGAGLAGLSRGFSLPSLIAIWSSKIAELDFSRRLRRPPQEA